MWAEMCRSASMQRYPALTDQGWGTEGPKSFTLAQGPTVGGVAV